MSIFLMNLKGKAFKLRKTQLGKLYILLKIKPCVHLKHAFKNLHYRIFM